MFDSTITVVYKTMKTKDNQFDNFVVTGDSGICT